MLCINANKSGYFMIGDDVMVSVTKHNGQIKLGRSAPKDVRILRDKLVLEELAQHTQRDLTDASPEDVMEVFINTRNMQ